TDAVNKAQLDEVAGSVGELADSAVQYDDETKGTVTLGGEDGTVVTNVAAGELSADSTDAVNGSQLFETNERVGVVEGRVDDLDTRIGDVEGGVANAVQYDDETKATATLAGEDGTVVSNLAAGAISATSTDAINGSQLYDALDQTAADPGGPAAVTAFAPISAPSRPRQGRWRRCGQRGRWHQGRGGRFRFQCQRQQRRGGRRRRVRGRPQRHRDRRQCLGRRGWEHGSRCQYHHRLQRHQCRCDRRG